MFLFGDKRKVSYAVDQAVKAILTGYFVDRETISRIDTSEDVVAVIHLESHAQCVVTLYSMFRSSIVGDKHWATVDYFVDELSRAMSNEESDKGLPPGVFCNRIIPRFIKILESHRRNDGQFDESVNFTYAVEHELDKDENGISSSLMDMDLVVAALTYATEKFEREASVLFPKRQ